MAEQRDDGDHKALRTQIDDMLDVPKPNLEALSELCGMIADEFEGDCCGELEGLDDELRELSKRAAIAARRQEPRDVE